MNHRTRMLIVPIILFIAGLACNAPFVVTDTPQAAATANVFLTSAMQTIEAVSTQPLSSDISIVHSIWHADLPTQCLYSQPAHQLRPVPLPSHPHTNSDQCLLLPHLPAPRLRPGCAMRQPSSRMSAFRMAQS